MPQDVVDALRESEQRYRTLFEQAPVGVFVYDRQLRLVDFNARFVAIVCAEPERLRGLDLNALRDRRIAATLEAALRGKLGSYEGPYEATASQARIGISLRTAPLHDARGEVVGALGMVENATERTRAESTLRASEQRLALHVRRSPLGVVVFDTEGTILEWNPSARRIFGWSEQEALGRNAIDLMVPPRAREIVADVFRALVARTGGERSVNENTTKDGRVILCDWYNAALADDRGHVIGVASVIDDITERHHAEELLKRSEARFRTLIEGAPDAIAVYPPDDGRLVYANPAWATMLGYDAPAEMLGMRFDDQIHADDHALLARRRARLAATHGPLPPHEYRMLRKDGGVVHAEIVSMMLEYDGRPHTILFARDLTERRQMQARLLLADRMVSVGTLAAGVAHEINNPLAYVMTNLEMVATRRLPPLAGRLQALGGRAAEAAEAAEELSRVMAMIDVAREGCERMRDIVRDLRTFTHGAAAEARAPVDVRRVLDASINLAWNEIRHRARLVKQYDEVPPILANEARLGQVFLNVLVNAAQALPVGGAAENAVRVRATTDRAGHVVVEVSDTGPGIAAEILDRIFDPFFTTKPVGVGTGLGLWICQGIVTSLGGQITAESTPGEGATFRVTLPSATSVAQESTAAPAPGAPRREEHRLRLLVVDDEIAIGRTLAIALSDDFEVATATSGREALELLQEQDRFDVILCDLMMPDVSGMDVYERVVAARPEMGLRFVFVTGGAFTERARTFVDKVRAPVVEKPFELMTLPDLLRSAASG